MTAVSMKKEDLEGIWKGVLSMYTFLGGETMNKADYDSKII